jgi:hypothetical protein
MNFVKVLLGFSAVVQIYYLYEFIYSIPMKKEIPQIKTGNKHANVFLRGSNLFTDSYREKRTQKRQQQQHPMQMMRDNNTALIYKSSTNLDVAYHS